jgi:hypothetical protein
VTIIWDYYLTKLKINYDTKFFDFFCVAMLINIKDKLLKSNQTECFQILFNYPDVENIFDLIKLESNLEKEYNIKEKNEKKIDIKKIFFENKEKTNLFTNFEKENKQNKINKINYKISLVPPEKPNELKVFDNSSLQQEINIKNQNKSDLENIKLIFNKYKNNFNDEDQKTFNEIIQRLEKNLN